MPPNTPPRMMRLAIEFQECCLPEVGRSGGIVNQTDYNNVKGAVTAGAGSGQRRGQSSLFSPRKRPPEKSARLTPTLESSLFSPTQTRKKCSTDPDAPPSP